MDKEPFFIKLSEFASSDFDVVLDLRALTAAKRHPNGQVDLHLASGSVINLVKEEEAEAVWGVLCETARDPQNLRGGKKLEAYP